MLKNRIIQSSPGGGGKKGNITDSIYFHYAIILLTLMVMLLPLYFFDGGGGITGFVTWAISAQSDFNEGTYFQTFYNTSFVQLNATYTIGKYNSKIFDTCVISQWNNISWVSNAIGELPDNAIMETKFENGNANMTGNVLLMHMNEANGNIIDYSGEGNDGSYNGALYSQTGKLNTAIGFDGINDYIDCGDISQTPSNFTIEFWSKRNPIPGGSYRVVLGLSNGYAVSLWIYEDGKIAFGSAAGGWDSWAGIWTDKSEFHHIAIVIDRLSGGNNARLFFDGDDKGTRTTNVAGSWDEVRIGGDWNYFNGTIDEFALYTRNLSATEVLDHYKRGGFEVKLDCKKL